MDKSNITQELYGTANYMISKLREQLNILRLDIRDAAYDRDNKKLTVLAGKVLRVCKFMDETFENEEKFYTDIISKYIFFDGELPEFMLTKQKHLQ